MQALPKRLNEGEITCEERNPKKEKEEIHFNFNPNCTIIVQNIEQQQWS